MNSYNRGLTFQEMREMQVGIVVRSVDPKATKEPFKITRIEGGMVFGLGINGGGQQGWYKTDCRIVQRHTDGGRFTK